MKTFKAKKRHLLKFRTTIRYNNFVKRRTHRKKKG